jgi:GTP pyrophosphokinase
VNLKLVPLSHVLRTGDQVEIITSRKQKPKAEWLKFVRTAKAISYIKSALKDDRQVYFDAGKDKLERILPSLVSNLHVGHHSNTTVYRTDEPDRPVFRLCP